MLPCVQHELTVIKILTGSILQLRLMQSRERHGMAGSHLLAGWPPGTGTQDNTIHETQGV
jgi:hypothetical protein